MIYRVLCNGWDSNAFYLDVWNKEDGPAVGRERLMGAFAAGVDCNWGCLVRPDVRHRHARFYFTAKGWQLIGRGIAAAARREGRMVRIVCRKNPAASEIVYADELQVALLPRKGMPRKNRK